MAGVFVEYEPDLIYLILIYPAPIRGVGAKKQKKLTKQLTKKFFVVFYIYGYGGSQHKQQPPPPWGLFF